MNEENGATLLKILFALNWAADSSFADLDGDYAIVRMLARRG